MLRFQDTVFGMRVNRREHLQVFESVLRELGWKPGCAEPEPVVDVMISLFVGKEPENGRRHFHLLYLDGSLVKRSFDLEEVVRALKAAYPRWVRACAKGMIFLPGTALLYRGKVIAVVGDEATKLSTEGRFEEATVLEESLLGLSISGELSLFQKTRPIDLLVLLRAQPKGLTEQSSGSRSESCLKILSMLPRLRVQPALSLQAVANLVQRTPIWEQAPETCDERALVRWGGALG